MVVQNIKVRQYPVTWEDKGEWQVMMELWIDGEEYHASIVKSEEQDYQTMLGLLSAFTNEMVIRHAAMFDRI